MGKLASTIVRRDENTTAGVRGRGTVATSKSELPEFCKGSNINLKRALERCKCIVAHEMALRCHGGGCSAVRRRCICIALVNCKLEQLSQVPPCWTSPNA